MPKRDQNKQSVAVNPVAPYFGGKRLLAKRLCEIIDNTDCTAYCEPFVGMGGVFLRRQKRTKVEVINDLSEDVSTLFRVLQRHYQPFIDLFNYQLGSRAEFDRLIKIDPSTLTDLERAARFLYLQRSAFGGKITGRSFGTSTTRDSRMNVTTLPKMIEAVHHRLAGVVIERLPYDDFIRRYDRKHTLFYLDPPYFNCEKDYGEGLFSRDDFAALAAQLAEIDGRFVMSINDVPEIRETFRPFQIRPVDVRYSVVGRGRNHMAKELIISNF